MYGKIYFQILIIHRKIKLKNLLDRKIKLIENENNEKLKDPQEIKREYELIENTPNRLVREYNSLVKEKIRTVSKKILVFRKNIKFKVVLVS